MTRTTMAAKIATPARRKISSKGPIFMIESKETVPANPRAAVACTRAGNPMPRRFRIPNGADVDNILEQGSLDYHRDRSSEQSTATSPPCNGPSVRQSGYHPVIGAKRIVRCSTDQAMIAQEWPCTDGGTPALLTPQAEAVAFASFIGGLVLIERRSRALVFGCGVYPVALHAASCSSWSTSWRAVGPSGHDA